jgi:hypothetical protein
LAAYLFDQEQGWVFHWQVGYFVAPEELWTAVLWVWVMVRCLWVWVKVGFLWV